MESGKRRGGGHKTQIEEENGEGWDLFFAFSLLRRAAQAEPMLVLRSSLSLEKILGLDFATTTRLVIKSHRPTARIRYKLANSEGDPGHKDALIRSPM